MSLLGQLLLFGRVLRAVGLQVHAGRMRDAACAIDQIGLVRRLDFFHALRSVLVHRREDLARFDLAFDLFWRERSGLAAPLAPATLGEQRPVRLGTKRGLPSDTGGSHEDGDASAPGGRPDVSLHLATYSPHEAWRVKDFSMLTADEIARAEAAVSDWTWDPGWRRTRRWVRGRGSTADLRRLIRENMKYGGELVDVPARARKEQRRPLVVICDVSGSMERYSRMLLHFLHALREQRRRVEAFLFATRLTRVTDHLARREIHEAMKAIPRATPDWAGGTRTGEALRSFNRRWARRVLARGPVVLLISDGWDRGDPDLLRGEIARLQRSCHRLIWLNPMLGSPSYEPLTRGMQAALPFVDDFLPAHNLVSLQALARHLETLPSRRPARRQYRPDAESPGRSVRRQPDPTRSA
jgi:uncharacterized protein